MKGKNFIMKILVADDEDIFRKLLCDFLKKDGYDVIEANNGKDALNLFQNNGNTINLAILDVMMPGMNGLEVCKQIKYSCANIPVLILTAKDGEEDQIQAFEAGADDYISKPFSFPILLLRVRALLKRYETDTNSILEYKKLKLDEKRHQVFIGGAPLELTPKEFEMLLYLVRNKGIVVSREDLLQKIWDYNFYGDERTVDTHIKNIRQKLGEDNIIKTIRGYGYKVEE